MNTVPVLIKANTSIVRYCLKQNKKLPRSAAASPVAFYCEFAEITMSQISGFMKSKTAIPKCLA